MGRSVLISHLHTLLNLVIKHGFPKLWTQSLIVPIFKNGDKSVPSNYKIIMINHILAKLYGLILERSLDFGLKTMVKELKGKLVLGDITRLSTTLSL